MIIPMELIAQMVIGANSGADLRHKGSADFDKGFRFDKVFEETQSKMNKPGANADGPRRADEGRPQAPITQQKPTDEPDEMAQAIAAAANLENVVIILEGDVESGTQPGISMEAMSDMICGPELDATAEQTEAVDIDPNAGGENKTEAQASTEGHNNIQSENNLQAETVVEQETEFAQEVKTAIFQMHEEAGGASGPDTQGAETKAVETMTDEAAPKADAQTAEGGDDAAIAGGQVAARMPEMEASSNTDAGSKDDEDSKHSDNGNLGPLENGNDTLAVKGHKPKAQAVKDETPLSGEKAEQSPTLSAAPAAEDVKPEIFRADQQIKSTMQAPTSKEDLFDEMVSRIEMMNTEDRQMTTIQLKPEFLGKVAIEIAMDPAGLHVKIDAADIGVRGMLNGQINALIEQLESKGMQVAEVEVAYTGVDNGSFTSQQNGQPQPHKSHRQGGQGRIEENKAIYAAAVELHEYYIESGLSSVEYRA